MQKYVLDTNIFIEGFRDPAANAELQRVSKAFGNDVLIAVSCREAGCILVTDNTRDFERIARVSRFRFVESFPAR